MCCLRRLVAVPEQVTGDCGRQSIEASLCRVMRAAKGTVEYMAPEVLQGLFGVKYEGQPQDIWSCGVMLCASIHQLSRPPACLLARPPAPPRGCWWHRFILPLVGA